MERTRPLFPYLILIAVICISWTSQKDRVLVFSKTTGFRHHSIEKGIRTIRTLGEVNGFEVVSSEDASLFDYEQLKGFKAIVFLNTTGDILNDKQKAAFQTYIRQGGGFVGVHAATDTEFEWPWYNQLVGAYFADHPEVQEAKLLKTNTEHTATKHLPKVWVHQDEWYNFKSIYPQIHTLLLLDERSYTGGKNGDEHPITWYHHFDGGRSFYTGLGHTPESYDEEAFQKLLLGGLYYAMGKKT